MEYGNGNFSPQNGNCSDDSVPEPDAVAMGNISRAPCEELVIYKGGKAVIPDGWCNTDINIIQYSLIWTFEDYHSACFMDMFKSSSFGSEKSTWRLMVNLNGFDEDSKDYISLYLCLDSCEGLNKKAKFKFCILDNNTEECRVMESRRPYIFSPGKDWGFKKFIRRDILVDNANKLLYGGKLSILCEVNVVADTHNKSGLFEWMSTVYLPPCTLSEDYGKLLKSKLYADIVIIVGNRKFLLHKPIVAARCPYLATVFANGCSYVKLDDTDNEIFEKVVEYMYTGKVTNLDSVADLLLTSAEKYSIGPLKLMCEYSLLHKIRVNNAANMYMLSCDCNAIGLKLFVKEFIVNNASAVVDTDGWKRILKDYPTLVAETFDALVKRKNPATAAAGFMESSSAIIAAMSEALDTNSQRLKETLYAQARVEPAISTFRDDRDEVPQTLPTYCASTFDVSSTSATAESDANVASLAPVMGPASVAEHVQIPAPASIAGSLPVSGSASVAGSVPVAGSALVVGSAPVEESVPAAESALVAGSPPAVGSPPIVGSALVAGSAPVLGYPPVAGSVPVSGPVSVSESGSVAEHVPVSGNVLLVVPRPELDIDVQFGVIFHAPDFQFTEADVGRLSHLTTGPPDYVVDSLEEARDLIVQHYGNADEGVPPRNIAIKIRGNNNGGSGNMNNSYYIIRPTDSIVSPRNPPVHAVEIDRNSYGTRSTGNATNPINLSARNSSSLGNTAGTNPTRGVIVSLPRNPSQYLPGMRNIAGTNSTNDSTRQPCATVQSREPSLHMTDQDGLSSRSGLLEINPVPAHTSGNQLLPCPSVIPGYPMHQYSADPANGNAEFGSSFYRIEPWRVQAGNLRSGMLNRPGPSGTAVVMPYIHVPAVSGLNNNVDRNNDVCVHESVHNSTRRSASRSEESRRKRVRHH